ncbi:hypothetical protein IT072_13775 [Leifsonia sp. ZF2019]|uniref:hypothetical protein n=1 Tax=Leifsonia sp. ZF2019 TaxID=2781978 RepID=UPI001CBE95C2|nr:hypothetical protein [Leifsonia sp. ZF2019]UAJ78327.1 hypothetical protein IT072_13775 [Leifsonia sp. ZF2019]
MMWEILGWVSAGCLALIVIGLTMAILIAIARSFKQPPTRKTAPVGSGAVTVFRSEDTEDPSTLGRRIADSYKNRGGI